MEHTVIVPLLRQEIEALIVVAHAAMDGHLAPEDEEALDGATTRLSTALRANAGTGNPAR